MKTNSNQFNLIIYKKCQSIVSQIFQHHMLFKTLEGPKYNCINHCKYHYKYNTLHVTTVSGITLMVVSVSGLPN